MYTNVCPQLGKIELSLFMRATTITTKGSIIVRADTHACAPGHAYGPCSMLTCTVLSFIISLSVLRSFRIANNIPMVLLSCWLTHRPVPSLSPGTLREMPIEGCFACTSPTTDWGQVDTMTPLSGGSVATSAPTPPLHPCLRSYARPSSDEEHRDSQPSSATETASPPPPQRQPALLR